MTHRDINELIAEREAKRAASAGRTLNCRDLTLMTQPAVGEFLKAKENEAFEALLESERMAVLSEGRGAKKEAEAAEAQRFAIARCDEWGALGMEC